MSLRLARCATRAYRLFYLRGFARHSPLNVTEAACLCEALFCL